ncbi:MAG: hypothetical protein WCH61_06075, partial [bacterium]
MHPTLSAPPFDCLTRPAGGRRGTAPRTCRPLLFLPFLLLGAGCLELDQRVTINADGSGEAEFRYTVPERTLPVLASGQARVLELQGRPPAANALTPNRLYWFLSEEATRTWFAGTPLKLASYTTTTSDGQRLVAILVRATDMRKALNSGLLGDFKLTRTGIGDYTLAAQLPETEAAPETVPDAKRLKSLQDALQGMKLRLRLQTPTPIIATSAPNPSIMQATWEFEPARQPELFSHPPKIEVTFSGEGEWKITLDVF